MGCTLLIKENLDSLTESETRLAAYLLEHSGEVPRMSAKGLADACSVSAAAVVRFAQRLGFTGFTDLKLDLAREAGAGRTDEFQTAIWDGDDWDTLVRKAERIHLRNIRHTYEMLNLSVLEQAVGALCAGREVYLYGIGASGLMVQDFYYKVSRIGVPALYHPDPHANLVTAALLTRESTALAVSYSGETRETILAAQAAKERGCKLITITQANRNSLVRLADYPLYVPGEEPEFRVGAMTSRSSTLLILDLLYLGLARRDPAGTEARLGRTRDLIRALQTGKE